MNFLSIILIIAGLCLFEIVNSIDNSIINSQVLSTMQRRARRWFLLWGMLFAVFVVRGLLPWIIVWISMPTLGPLGALTATFSNSPQVISAIGISSPILLMGGGMFLFLLFLHWIFLEEKKFGCRDELILTERRIGFWVSSLIILVLVVWFLLKVDKHIALGAIIGAGVFFITSIFKKNASRSKRELAGKKISDVTKIIYLEIIDATFSIDGILGAFAFTLCVPLILIGNGLGAFVVRQLTVRNVEKIKKYIYLRDGAMYSILCLGIIMIIDGFGYHTPIWLSPAVTFLIVGFFFYKSHRHIRKSESNSEVDKKVANKKTNRNSKKK